MFLDIKMGNKQSGRIVIELRPDVVPKTAGKLSTEKKSFLLSNSGFMLTLQATRCAHDSMNRPNNAFITYIIYILYHQSSINFQF